MKKILLSFLIILPALFISCGPSVPGEKGTEIITAEKAVEMISEGNISIIDARKAADYSKSHVKNAVNVSRNDIVDSSKYPNMLAGGEQISEVLGSRGISNDKTIVVYDDNKNMDSARLWWTLKVYGNDNVKVVSGGLKALESAGAEMSSAASSLPKAEYKVSSLRSEMIADLKYMKKQVNKPSEDIVIIDTRTKEEYEEGTIPGSYHLNFVDNNFKDGTYKPVQQISIRYLEQGISADKEAVMYCKTSIRGAQTYLALYNAGYRKLKLYDGAWVEWSSNPLNPIYKPEKPAYMIDSSDNS